MIRRTVQNALVRTELLLDVKQYKRALAELEIIDLNYIETDKDRSMYYYYLAKSNRGLGKYDKALEQLKPALVLSRQAGDESLYADEKNLLGLIFVALGRIVDAIEAYTEALTFRKKTGENEKIYGLLVNLALAHFLKGNLATTLGVLDDALEYAKKYNGAKEVTVCQTNRVRVMLLLGEFSKAISILESYENDPDVGEYNRAFIIQSFGMLHTYLLNKTEAENYLKDALHRYDKLGMKREVVVSSEYLGMNEYFAGNPAKAREYYEDIIGRNEITVSASAQTWRMSAETYIAEGNFNEAAKAAKKAEDAISKVSEQIELGALRRIYGQIEVHKGNWDKAHDYYAGAMAMLIERGVRYELGLTYLVCGDSPVYTKYTRLAFLQKARKLFIEMQVPKRVEQAESAIQNLELTFEGANAVALRVSSSLRISFWCVIKNGLKRISGFSDQIAPTIDRVLSGAVRLAPFNLRKALSRESVSKIITITLVMIIFVAALLLLIKMAVEMGDGDNPFQRVASSGELIAILLSLGALLLKWIIKR